MGKTRILPVPDPDSLGRFRPLAPTAPSSASPLDRWDAAETAPGLSALRTAAGLIRNTDTPVGFPTETVYGLGADATRSAAVRGIFAVKGRPSDNPLIVHICDLDMLRGLLGEGGGDGSGQIPAIYRPLLERFWPGPLTILLPVPSPSAAAAGAPRWTLAPEVTAGLPTFGARLPASPLTRTLIRLADAPLAGPSANASTRPSPTTAQHVVDDLDGRIDVVLDGGACGVGVESTVVDGLCDPPVVLRPGGISLAELRTVPGWERVERAYHDAAHGGNADARRDRDGTAGAKNGEAEQFKPRAPGMKYKHYSPRARVVLYEGWSARGRAGIGQGDDAERPHDWLVQTVLESASAAAEGRLQPVAANGAQHSDASARQRQGPVVGVIRTTAWPPLQGSPLLTAKAASATASVAAEPPLGVQADHQDPQSSVTYDLREHTLKPGAGTVLELDLGRDVPSVAHGLFSALRDLDARGADVILVEGVDDRQDDMAAAVMNRLRKAASEVQ